MSMAVKKLAVVPAAREAASPGSIRLARVAGREGDLFRVVLGRREQAVACDPSVDPALIEEAIASGARVVVEEDTIVGTLATTRSIPVDRQGAVQISVTRFEVTAREALLKTGSAFVSIKNDEVEIFGRRILSRARELARVLARAIQLN
jgi:hypothetical protein